MAIHRSNLSAALVRLNKFYKQAELAMASEAEVQAMIEEEGDQDDAAAGRFMYGVVMVCWCWRWWLLRRWNSGD